MHTEICVNCGTYVNVRWVVDKCPHDGCSPNAWVIEVDDRTHSCSNPKIYSYPPFVEKGKMIL